MTRIAMQCPRCGNNEDVVRDAYATWNIRKQEWVLGSVYDSFACNGCGANDIRPEEVEPREE